MAYYQGKDYKSAAQSFARVRQTYAKDYFSRAAFYEGLSYGKLGRTDDAALAFERSRLFDESHPDAAHALLGLSLTSLEKQDVAGAREQLDEFVEDYPQDERVPGARESLTLLEAYGQDDSSRFARTLLRQGEIGFDQLARVFQAREKEHDSPQMDTDAH